MFTASWCRVMTLIGAQPIDVLDGYGRISELNTASHYSRSREQPLMRTRAGYAMA